MGSTGRVERRLSRLERQHLVLLGGIVSGHDGAGGLGGAQVDGLVRHARRNEEKLAGLADDFVLQRGAPTGQYAAFEDVEGGFVAQVDVWFLSGGNRR